MATRNSRLHVPVRVPEDVVPHLARGELHWKAGYSAHALATSWIAADGFPASVKTVLDSCGPFTDSTLLDAFFERETDLRDGLGRASQTDLLALVRTHGGVVVVAVEGKVEESFGALIGDRAALSPGQQERLRGLCRLFEVDEARVGPLRYQLFHRAAAAVFEADRYGAKTCMLLVHSFSPHQTGRIDFERFCDSLGLGGSGDARGPIGVLGVQLYAAWVADRLAVAAPERARASDTYGNGSGRVDPLQLRRLLVSQAKAGCPITYKGVAAAFGEPWHQGFGSSLKRALNIVGDDNRAAGEPMLMALVVNKDTGQPGPGFFERIGEPKADAEKRTSLMAAELDRLCRWTW